MKKSIITVIVISFLSGCLSMESIRTKNRENLNGLSMGMTKQEVLTKMGTLTIRADDGSKVSNPWRTEILKGNDKEYYEVLFYYTDTKKADGAITDDELTPLVLKENKLIGWGWSFLNDNITKYQIDIR